MKKLAIIGSGDLAQQISLHVESDKQFEVVGYFDDFKESGFRIMNASILGQIKDITRLYKDGIFDELLIGVGYRHMNFRKDLFERYNGSIPFATIIDSTCIIDPTCSIAKGAVLYPGSIIDQYVNINENVLVNLGCCISHNSEIGAHSFLSPRVAIGGFSTIGELSVLGINSTIIDNISIAAGTQIGGGAVVINNIEKRGVYVGNPVKHIR
jgi:sugar O-acyltransferase (sialic acid O-acetyltransferase NeuD family)